MSVALEAKFAEFPTAIIETHGKDLTVSAEPSRTGTPVQSANATSTSTAAPPAPKPVVKSPPPKTTTVNTSTVEVEATFMATADDLFSLFTDKNRIPIWSRAPAEASPIFCAYMRVFDTFCSLTPLLGLDTHCSAEVSRADTFHWMRQNRLYKPGRCNPQTGRQVTKPLLRRALINHRNPPP